MIEMTCACGNPALRSTWSHTPTACELPPRRPLGRIAAINGNVVTIADGLTDGFRIGQRIIADDNRAGITPNAGFTTVEEIDADAGLVRVDGPARMNACVGDYLFEKQPTAEESRAADIDRRLADLERRVAGPEIASARPMVCLGDFIPATASDVAIWRRRAESLAGIVYDIDRIQVNDHARERLIRLLLDKAQGTVTFSDGAFNPVWDPNGSRPEAVGPLMSGAVPPAHPDPAALIRAAIAKAAPRAVCNPADLMALATALECVNRALPVTDLMQPPDLKRVDELVQLRRRLAKVEALANHWRSRDTGDQWAVRDLCAALRGEDPSDG